MSLVNAGLPSTIKSIQTVSINAAANNGSGVSATITAVVVAKTVLVVSGLYNVTSNARIGMAYVTLTNATTVLSQTICTTNTDSITANIQVVEYL